MDISDNISSRRVLMSQTNTKYKGLIRYVLEDGAHQVCRNGSQLIVPSASFTLNWGAGKDDTTITLRKIYSKGVLGEFRTLINKDEPLTNVKQFESKGCPYWKDWAGPNGELNLDYYNMLHPQLEDIIEQINRDPHSRRHVISLWNHEHVKSGELSLPCCWWGLTFSVINGVLHLTWVQRSVDLMVGLPSDMILAYFFMFHIVERTGLTMGTCMFALSNVHIYEEHILGARELLDRKPEDYGKPLKFKLKA
jgi:thymidylate synthase